MNVLVTGGAGYIGSVAAEELINHGHKVTVFDNLELGHREALDARAEFIQGDLRNGEDIAGAMGEVQPDAVMHFAAYALVGQSMENPLMYFHNNMSGGVNLARAMRKTGVKKIIFSSTCATYGPPRRIPIDEEHPQEPVNPYGESKYMFERVLEWCRTQWGFQPVFLRYFNACGATERLGEDHDPESHLIPNVLKVALGQKDKVLIFGDDYDTPDGTCIRDYIHIVDLIQAHIQALEKDVTGPFNLGNGDGYSVKDIVDIAREVTGHDIPAEIAPRRPGDPSRLIAAAGKAKSVLGWNPEYADIRSIVESAWNWHQRHPNGYRDTG